MSYSETKLAIAKKIIEVLDGQVVEASTFIESSAVRNG